MGNCILVSRFSSEKQEMINNSRKVTFQNGFFSSVCIEKTMQFVVFLHSMVKTVHMIPESTASKKRHT